MRLDKLIRVKNIDKIFKLSLASLLIVGLLSCKSIENLNIKPIVINMGNDKTFGLEILIENKKLNGELISIGSKGVQSVLIDGSDYPIEKLLKNQFKIELSEIVVGKHKLEVSLYSLKKPFVVPLVIPNIDTPKISIILRFSVNDETGELQKIEYGYDLDKNGLIDLDMSKFESIDSETFSQILNDGSTRKISIDTNLDDANLTDQRIPPPGVIPNSGTSQTGQTDVKIPQINIELPKPYSETADVYPLPPIVIPSNLPINQE